MAPIFWKLDSIVFDYSPLTAILICFILACVYVGSLYVFTKNNLPRDHPKTIKQRFVRVAVVCVLVIPLLWLCSTSSHSVKARALFTWLGLRFYGLVQATLLPLLLTVILFMGPLTLHYLDGVFSIYKDPKYWLSNVQNLIWLRNHIVAPLSEEFIFRACMSPLLVPCFGEYWAILTCPLFFGVAHFHHMIEKIKDGLDTKTAFLNCLFQFAYTSVFGAYSAFLFLRTDHLVAPVVAHAFCNHMGFPNFQQAVAHPYPNKIYILLSFVIGLLLWLYLLYPLTSPSIYSNDLYF